MSDIQRITVRNATTELQIADNQTTGNLDIGGAQTTGNIYVGNSSARTTGAVQIGTLSGSSQTLIRGNTINANSGSSSTYQGSLVNLISTSGNINVQANSNATVTSVAGTVDIGTTNRPVEIGSGATTSAIDIGDALTTGDINIGSGAARTTGDLYLGSASGTSSVTTVRGNTIDSNANGTHTVAGGIVNCVASTGDAFFSGASGVTVSTTGGNATVTGATNLVMTAGVNASLTTTAGDISIDGATTTDLTGGTGVSMIATTGSAVLTGGSNVTVSGTSGTAQIFSAGDASITSTTSGATIVGVSGADRPVRIGEGNITSDIDIGTGQTSGVINIGTDVARSGIINIGASGGTHETQIRSATLDSSTSGATEIQAGGDMNIYTTGGGVLLLGGSANSLIRLANGNTTEGVVIAGSQTSGTVSIGGLSTRTGAVSVGSSSGNFLFNVRSGTMNLETRAAAGDMTIVSSRDIDMTAVGDITINSSGGTTFLEGNDMAGTAGSWTPVLGDGLGGFYGGQTTAGTYQKYGKVVVLYGTVAWTSKGSTTGTGNFQVTGLPFNRLSATNLHMGEYSTNTWFSGTGSLRVTVHLSSGGTTVMNALKGTTNLLVSDTVTAGGFRFSFTYISA